MSQLEQGKTYSCVPKSTAQPKYAKVNAYRYEPMGAGIDPAKEYAIINGQRTNRQSDKVIFVGVSAGYDFTIIDHVSQSHFAELFNVVQGDVATAVFTRDAKPHNAFPKASAPADMQKVRTYLWSPPTPGETVNINGKHVKRSADTPILLYSPAMSDPGTDSPCVAQVSESFFNEHFVLQIADGSL